MKLKDRLEKEYTAVKETYDTTQNAKTKAKAETEMARLEKEYRNGGKLYDKVKAQYDTAKQELEGERTQKQQANDGAFQGAKDAYDTANTEFKAAEKAFKDKMVAANKATDADRPALEQEAKTLYDAQEGKRAALATAEATFEPLRREKQERTQLAADKTRAEGQVQKITDAKGLYDTKKGEVDTAKTAVTDAEAADPQVAADIAAAKNTLKTKQRELADLERKLAAEVQKAEQYAEAQERIREDEKLREIYETAIAEEDYMRERFEKVRETVQFYEKAIGFITDDERRKGY